MNTRDRKNRSCLLVLLRIHGYLFDESHNCSRCNANAILLGYLRSLSRIKPSILYRSNGIENVVRKFRSSLVSPVLLRIRRSLFVDSHEDASRSRRGTVSASFERRRTIRRDKLPHPSGLLFPGTGVSSSTSPTKRSSAIPNRAVVRSPGVVNINQSRGGA